ncbi:MAG: hypothetical protein Q4E57_04135, partial [Eubacteriales bacterium]|nr:hypothetical protein [Eubacteriales bacterium]
MSSGKEGADGSAGQIIDKLLTGMEEKMPSAPDENEFFGEDGLLYCRVWNSQPSSPAVRNISVTAT